MPKPMTEWIQGMPPRDAVEQHEADHPFVPFKDLPNQIWGGRWLIVDPQARTEKPEIASLHVATASDVKHPNCDFTEGEILIGNGFSFWQSLNKTQWAGRCGFRPCKPDGTPVPFTLLPRNVLADRLGVAKERLTLNVHKNPTAPELIMIECFLDGKDLTPDQEKVFVAFVTEFGVGAPFGTMPSLQA